MVAEVPDPHGEDGAERVEIRQTVGLDRAHDRGFDPTRTLLAHRGEQVELVPEVLEQGSLGNAGFTGDDVEAARREALGAELDHRHMDDAVPLVLWEVPPRVPGHGEDRR